MVTRIYNPLSPPLSRPLAKKGTGQEGSAPQGGFDPHQGSKGLATLIEQNQTQKIQLKTILQDFKSTMGAIGTSETIREEVDSYLQAIAVQAKKPSPSVPFIKQSLKTAADSLDQYISTALGQPSRVVRDWVDALLLQNINYHSPEGEAAATTPAGSTSDESQEGPPTPAKGPKPMATLPPQANPPDLTHPTLTPLDALTTALQRLPEEAGTPDRPETARDLDASQKTLLKGYVQQGKTAVHWQQEVQAYQEGLSLLANTQRPDLNGKLHTMTAKAYDKGSKLPEAIAHYEEAVNYFEAAQMPDRQASTHYSLGSLYEEKGDFSSAQAHYQASLTLDQALGNLPGVAQNQLQLGSLALRMGDPGYGLSHLKEAYQAAYQNNTAPTTASKLLPANLIPDIFEHMGMAYQQLNAFPQAEKALNVVVTMALQNNLEVSASSALERLADIAHQSGNPAKAARYRQQAEALLG